jgi:hypothetical protein
MPRKLKFGDPVFYGDPPLSYLSTSRKNATSSEHFSGVVGFGAVTVLDESQNAARIVREATED